jgi:hypothetical protein
MILKKGAAARDGIELRANHNQFISTYTSLVDWIQNIRVQQGEKADDCDAGVK